MELFTFAAWMCKLKAGQKTSLAMKFFSALKMEMEATLADFLKIGITSVCVSGHYFLLSAGTFSGDQPVNDPGV
jgi:hypothetical protein